MQIEHLLKPISPGSKVKLNRSTNSFAVHQEVVIFGYKDGDQAKVVVDGIIPGGWIPATYFVRELNPVRIMTITEMLLNNTHYTIISELISKLQGLVINASCLDSKNFSNIDWKAKTVGYVIKGGIKRIPMGVLLLAETPVPDPAEFSMKFEPEAIVYDGPSEFNHDLTLKTLQGFQHKYDVAGQDINERYLKECLYGDKAISEIFKYKSSNYKIIFHASHQFCNLYRNNQLIRTAAEGLQVVNVRMIG